MVQLAIEISKYLFVILLALFTIMTFAAVKRHDDDERGGIYIAMGIMSFLFHTLGMGDLLLLRYADADWESFRRLLFLYGAEVFLLLLYRLVLRLVYKHPHRLLAQEMSMLLSVGFVLLARLNLNHAWRQFIIISVSVAASLFLPLFFRYFGKLLTKLTWIYGGVGLFAIAIVLFTGKMVNGSKLSYQLFGLTFQPSEAVKILFALFIAGVLAKSADWKHICVSAAAAAMHVLILVASKDLGSALIFFIMYVTMAYVASGKQRYLLAGFAGGAVAAVMAYLLFSHVRLRVQTWMDPWADPDNKGYQLTQSLFGIATGRWFGMGFGHGSPKTIPYVEEDFAFSALVEEFGTFFGILLILLCLGVTLTMLVMASRIKEHYYRIVASGLAVCYGVQVILTVGGGIGFIPLTGVTLPLISNGGTSALVTIMLFGILQGIYMIRVKEMDGTAEAKAREKRIKKLEKERRRQIRDGVPEEELPFAEEILEEEEGEAAEELYQSNRCVLICGLLYAVIYLAMLGKLIWFVHADAMRVITNPYNRRLMAILEQDNVRGTIYAADGSRIAYSEDDEDGVRVRVYPYGGEYAHVIGYATHGGLGVEGYAQRYLMMSDAGLATRIRNEIEGVPHSGNDVYTTLIPELQSAAYSALGDNKGAVIVTDVKTGAVLAMVSKPSFDPAKIDVLWDDIVADEENSALVNRVSQGLYPPGSTFKILSLLEYLREHPEDYDDYRYQCTGQITIKGSVINCYHGTAHGDEDLRAAFAKSCNTAFADIGDTLDRTRFAGLLNDAHFNETFGTEFPSNASHIVMNEEISTNDMLMTVIGQSETGMSPMHLNMITAAIANGGTMMLPYVIEHVETSDGRVLMRGSEKSLGEVMTAEECGLLTGFMEAVIGDGTASRLAEAPYSVAGKTGSAEFSMNKGESHAWFTAFAPAEAPEIAITVIVEGGGSGGSVAVPVAKEVLDEYFTR